MGETASIVAGNANPMNAGGSTFLEDFEAEPIGPRFRLRWVTVPLLVLAFATALGRWAGFDFGVQKLIYRAGGNSWALGDHWFWQGLYHLGTWPTLIVVVAAICGYLLSWYRRPFRRWRRVFLFLVLSGLIGPGVIANLTLKEYWGRPRPREVETLGGHNAFEPVLSVDRSSDGKSFPCGHATMGFYFFCGFFLLRRHRRNLAELFLIGALIVGSLMGVARMLQGAHFFSDVAWAAAVCWFTPMGLYYAFKLDRGLARRGLGEAKMPLWLTIAVGTTVVSILGAVLLASPYRDQRNIFIVNEFAKTGPLIVHLRLTKGETEIFAGEEFGITGEAYGHGVPTSQIAEYYEESDNGDHAFLLYSERLSGWLAEVNEQLKVRIPFERLSHLKIDTSEAKIWIDLDGVQRDSTIRLLSGEGRVFVRSGRSSVRVRGPGAKNVEGKKRDGEFRCRIVTEEAFSGRISIE